MACLKRALYLEPFEWIISYNLGLVHLSTGQFASAFHFLSASINLHPDFPSAYHYLAVALAKLDDLDHAIVAYDRAATLEDDLSTRLNFAITLTNAGKHDDARKQLSQAEALYSAADDETRDDPGINERMTALRAALGE